MFESNLSATDKIMRAKIKLQDERPFFSFLIMHFNVTRDDLKVPTMGVDPYGNLLYNEKFVDGLSESQLKTVLCHEVMHIVFEHLLRYQGFEHKIKNISDDIKVNDVLIEDGMHDFPPGGLVPSGHNISVNNTYVQNINDKTSEEIYTEILKISNKPGAQMPSGFDVHFPGNAKGDGDGDEDESNPAFGDVEGEQDLKNKWKEVITQAATIARQRGLLPAGVAIALDDLLEPKMDWKTLLYNFITQDIVYDFTYMRPHKKSHSTGFYFPNTYKENIDLVVHWDTSGSMSNEIQDLLDQLYGLLNAFNNIHIDWIICDAAIQGEFELTREDRLDLTSYDIRGWGGTSHMPVVEWINEHRPTCKLFVSMTDGYSDIQQCYGNLPPCHKIILLPKNCAGMVKELEEYATCLVME